MTTNPTSCGSVFSFGHSYLACKHKMDRKLCRSFLALLLFIREAHLSYYPTVFWTPTNCRFNLNKLNNGEGYFIKVKSFSNMYFMCPHISIWAGKSDMSPNSRMMHENIILVDEESYNLCSIKNATRAKTLLTCDADPVDDSAKYSKEHFVSVQASPDKQCYNVGQHYYFISTSDGSAESLTNTEGGHCKTHHMKLHIYVCNENDTCAFEMPECPKETEQGNNQTIILSTPRPNCTDDSGSTFAQTGVKGWFSDNRHPVLYAVMGLVIVILLVVILWLFHDNRKYRKAGATVAKENKKKLSTDKQPMYC